LYDSNEISIEGDTAIAFTESVRGRYEALGWHTLLVEDGNNLDDLREAIDEAKQAERPTLIEVRTQIGFGSPRVGTAKAHGEALGEENVTLTRAVFSW
jgi:transketolase